MNILDQIKDIYRKLCCLSLKVDTIEIGSGGVAVIHPTYVPPLLVLSATGDEEGNYESGVLINPVLDRAYIQNDAGAITSETLNRTPGGTISTTYAYTDVNYQIVDGETQYQAAANYGAGAVKNNNLGNPDPIGQILAGSLTSNILLYNGSRSAFWDAITGSVPTDSAGVRALAHSLVNPSGKDFVINIPEGTVHVVFAIPDAFTLDYVQYIEFGNADVQAIFDITTFMVAGANGYSPVLYRIYSYTPVEPFPSEVNYRVKATA